MRSCDSFLLLRRFISYPRLSLLAFLLILLGSQPLRGRPPQVLATAGPRIWLRDAEPIAVSHVGSTKAMQTLSSAEPLALAKADFDADGVDDLVVGYASANGGILAFHRGNLDAFAPQSEESFQAIGRGEFPSPFLPTATLVEVPVRPDFVQVGSFNGEGYPDVIVAQRNDSSVYLLGNNGKGVFAAPQRIDVGGPITTTASGDLGPHGIYSKLLVGISDHSGSHLMVFTGTLNGLGGVKVLSLPGRASDINFGHLGDNGQDAIFVAGGQVMILHSLSMRLETLSLPLAAQSIALGSFIWDRNPQLQIAVMDSNGTVHIAAHSEFDARSYTAAELGSIARSGHAGLRNSLVHPLTVPMKGWQIIETLSGIAPSSGPRPIFLRTRISDHGADDLIVLNALTSQMTLIAHPDSPPGTTTFAAAEISYRPYFGSPSAAIAMRTNIDGRAGIVAVHQGQVAPSVMMPLPDPTFNVNTTSDGVFAGACAAATPGQCTLREAILEANAASGTDTIVVPSGTYSLTIGRPSTPDYTGHAGALYVNDSVNIVGAAQNSTIVQWGTPSSGTVDMVMAVNEDVSSITSATASISNLTIQNGVNHGAQGVDGDGGCMEFDTGSSGTATLTLTNVTLQNCSTLQGGGGGLVIFNFLASSTNGTAGATISNSIFQGNSVVAVGQAGNGGGIAIAQDGHMTMTASQVKNNNATQHNASGIGSGGGIVAFTPQNISATAAETFIHSSTISGNKAASFGGGINTNASISIDQGTVISGNAAGTDGTSAIANQEGGGLYLNPAARCPSSSTCTVTLSKVTITGNTATGNGGGISYGNGSAGTVGSLSMSFCRLAANATSGGSGSNLSNNHGAGTVTDNWWGTNSPAGTINSISATTTFDPFIVVTHTASPAKIRINQSSTLTGSFLQDNHGTAIAVSNLDELLGLPITFNNPVLGTIPEAQPENIISTGGLAGTASATFNAGGTGGQGHADAVVDQATATADIVVLQPPSIIKNFSPTTVPINSPSTLTFSITNGNVVPINGSFTDTLPTGLVVATTPTVVNGCGGTVTATAGSGSVSFANSALAVGTCTVSVNVQSATDNTYSNSVTIDSSDAGNGNTSTAVLTVISPPAITKSFGAATIPLNGTTSLSFAVSNPNTNETLSGITFADSLPAGLIVASPNGLTGSSCGGTVTTTAGAGSVSLSGGTLTPGGSCTISLNVKGATAGEKDNSVQVSSTNGGTGNTSNASVTVIGPPTIAQIDSLHGSVSLNSVDTLEFTITNPNPTPITLTGIGFTDTLSAGLAVAAGPQDLGCGGTLTATVGAQTFSLSGGTLAGGASCSVEVNVTGTAAGDQTSVSSAITSNEGGNGQTTSVTINVVAPPWIAKLFNPSTIAVNATTALQFTISNPTGNTVSETGVAFQDTLPTGLTVASSSSTVCGGTLQTFATSNAISLSSASVAVGTPCTFSVTVTGAASGQYTNTTAAVTSVNGGTGNTASANLTVASPATITKSFGAATIPLNGTTSLSFALSNPNTIGLTRVAFTDSLPGGLVVATPNGLNSSCGSAIAAVPGSSSVSLTGGAIASGGSCAVSLNVQGTTAGVKNNTVTSSSTEGGTSAPSTATLTVVGPPTMIQSFGATSVPLNGETTLTFNINNPNTVSSLSGLHFQSVLSGVLTDIPPAASNTCGGTLTAANGSGTIVLSGGTLAASGSCAVQVTVHGSAAGTGSSSVATVDSTEGGSSTLPTASIFVVAPPSIARLFNPSSITLNSTTSLNFTLTNPAGNTTSELGVAFTDTLPTGLTVASSTSTVCGGTLSTTAPTGISLTGANIATGTPCTFGVTVTGAASGSYTNTTGNISSTNGGTGNTATAGLTVATPPSMTKSFGATSIPLNGTTSMTFNISNPNGGSFALSGVQFTDSLPLGLIASSTTASNTCGGTATVGSGGLTLTLTGGSIAASSSCSVSATVQGTTAGVKNNSTTVSSSNAGTGNTAMASITVVAPPVASKNFGASSIPLGGSTSLGFQISNPNPTLALTGINLNDLVQTLITFQPTSVSGSCGGGTISATSNSISLSGRSLAAGGTCNFSVNVNGAAAGTVNNTTSAVTSNEGGTGNTASASLFVVAPPSIAKAFTPSLISINGTTSLGFTITNPTANTVAQTGVAFTDTLPVGLTVANGTGTACGGTFTTTGSNTISLSGATIAAGGRCTPSVTVSGTQPGMFTNITGNVSSTNGGTGNTATASLQVGDFSLKLSPTTETVPPGHMGVYTLNITSTGFMGGIDFTCGGGPAGSKCSVVPNSVTINSATGTASVSINFAVPKGASKGTFLITVTGKGGGLTRTATATLKVGLNQ